MSEWGTKQHKAEQNWMKNAWRDEKKIATNQNQVLDYNYKLIHHKNERWTMNEWMNEFMDGNNRHWVVQCSIMMMIIFITLRGWKMCGGAACLFLSYGNKFVSDLWFMIDCELKNGKSSQFYVLYCINAIDLMMILFFARKWEKNAH